MRRDCVEAWANDLMLAMTGCLQTGQTRCYDDEGRLIPCGGSGQDACYRKGQTWPSPRFLVQGEQIEDRLTGLVWSRDANPSGFPLTWQEALDFVAGLNGEIWLGASDWRLPNRRELHSLLSFQTRRPALPEGHPFSGVFPSWYWTSTSLARAPTHAWYVNLDGARSFYGGKDQSFLVWPVRGHGAVLAQTGQGLCYASDGAVRPCSGTGEDGEYRAGRQWPERRLVRTGEGMTDGLTGLVWHPSTDAAGGPVTWSEALAICAALGEAWRLPNINELESLVDCGRYQPALPEGPVPGHVFAGYWSSTTSLFEPDWAWALYAQDGGIGVGQKGGRHFHVWAVRDGDG